MWIYHQSTGELERDGTHVAVGYSGAEGDGLNNPAMQSVHQIGPIPQGRWTIEGPPVTTHTHGPYVLRLVPVPDTETFGRSGFLIHGDSIRQPGHASQGCIILPRPTRELIWESSDRNLTVTG